MKKNKIIKPSFHTICKEWECTKVKTFTRTHKSLKDYKRVKNKNPQKLVDIFSN